MYFDSFEQFLNMGGYAAYVWSAFGITFISMLVLLLNSLRAGKQLLKDVKNRVERQVRIDAAKKMENTL
ncbi:heme exporter protein D [Vibrio xiamenensis]|uniref:Heme exporter protein D n=1 Tax=Vibrio xiamenensis TaxID=861298 RepID=A0A1G8ELQ1_9VIBR|nr:heme exporter protein CcmD [Vibrio xiamenensis]SDH70797.1 heme exporter protein D [Vibrio xiamenensis]